MAASIVLERPFLRNRSQTASATLRRQKLYVLPTRYGLLFAVMILVMLIGGINYNNSMAYVLTFILSSVLLVGILHTHRNLSGLILTARRPEAVFAGQTAQFPILVDNRGFHLRCSIQLQHAQDDQPWFATSDPDQIVDIPADSLHGIKLRRQLPQRGQADYGRLRISTTFPLGLFRVWTMYTPDQASLVYPRPQGHLPLPESTGDEQLNRSGQHKGTDDFFGFRNYRPGDPAHSIAWKHYARERGLLVMRFTGHGSRRLVLNLEQAGQPAALEQALSQLCQWIIQAEQQGLVYGLQLGTLHLPPDNGEHHQHQCLEALACYDGPSA